MQLSKEQERLSELLAKAALTLAINEQVKTGLARYQDDPVAYANEVLQVRWWKKQIEIIQSIVDYKRTLVKAAFGVGKTYLAAGAVNWWYDCHPPDDTKIVTTAPTGNQVRNLLWTEIRSQRRTMPEAGVMHIKDPASPGHFAVGISPPRAAGEESRMGAQAFQGMHAEYLLVIFDEAAAVSADRWATAEDLIVAPENRMLAIGNPTIVGGPFYEATTVNKHLWNVITISALEHPNIIARLNDEPEPFPGAVSLEWVEERLSNPMWCEELGVTNDEDELSDWLARGAFEFLGIWYIPGPLAEAKILGKFPSQPTDTVWSPAWIEMARNRDLEIVGDTIDVGVDVARFGDDSTAFHARIGPVSIDHISWRKMDSMESAGNVRRRLIKNFQDYGLKKANIRVDTTADSGAGVADRLRETMEDYDEVRIIDVSSSHSANEPEYFVNTRSELWFAASYRAQAGDLDLTRLDQRIYELLLAQLTTPKWKTNSRGQKVVEEKAKIKQRLKRSPDDADAFNLAYIGSNVTRMDGSSITKGKTWDLARGKVTKPQEVKSPWTVSKGETKSRWSS